MSRHPTDPAPPSPADRRRRSGASAPTPARTLGADAAGSGTDAAALSGPQFFAGLDAPSAVGLALSGGVLRGAAHLGFLSVFDREEIRVDRIAGSSVGALVGAGYAAGIPAEELMESVRHTAWHKLISLPRSFELPGLLDRRPMEKLLREEWGLSTFDELKIPFCAVCCDLRTGERVCLRDGDVVQAALAASAVAGLFEACDWHGRLLMDGGTVDNLPVDVVREMGAGDVQGDGGGEGEAAGDDDPTSDPLAEPLAEPGPVVAVDLMADPWDGRPPGNLFEAAHRALYFLIRNNQPGPEAADLYVQPELAGLPFASFQHLEEYYALGQQAGEEAVPRIHRLLEQG